MGTTLRFSSNWPGKVDWRRPRGDLKSITARSAGNISLTEFGEWTQPRMLSVQFQHVKGNGLEQFKDTSAEVIVWPDRYKSGKAILPWLDAA